MEQAATLSLNIVLLSLRGREGEDCEVRDVLFESFLDGFVGNHLLAEGIGTGLRRLYHFDHFAIGTAFAFLQ